jgi:hypothetical protein
MILFLECGRLGNQLFQYCGFRYYCAEHKLIFVGFDDLQRHFNCGEVQFISKTALERWMPFGILRRVVFFLVAARILGRITEKKNEESFMLHHRKGLLWNVYVAQNVFFQHAEVVNRIEIAPRLNPWLIHLAYDWLKENKITPASDSPIFVHFRRGDYLSWPSADFPAVLDLVWYKRAIETMHEKTSHPVFILMSDDLFYLRDVFEESKNWIISDNPPEIDLAIMSLCHSGILSASSFAWWGAFLARSKRKQDCQFLAPLFWGGHRVKKWYPIGFMTDWITYQE